MIEMYSGEARGQAGRAEPDQQFSGLYFSHNEKITKKNIRSSHPSLSSSDICYSAVERFYLRSSGSSLIMIIPGIRLTNVIVFTQC